MAKKRGDNEGSIFQLQDGRWCGLINLGYRNGKRWRKKFTATTRREVQQKLQRGLEAISAGYQLDTEHLKVKQFLELWLRHSVRNAVRPATFDSYSRLVDAYLIPRLGRIELAKLSPQDVRLCLNDLLERGGVPLLGEGGERMEVGLSPRTVQYCRAVLRKALNQAVRDGLVTKNAAALTDPPKVKHPEISPYSPEQARALLSAVKGDRLEALFTVAVSLGLRQGEVLGLRWPDIDFERRTLSVRYALQRVKGEPVFVEPKTRRSRRTITLPIIAISALHMHRIRQADERAACGTRWQEWNLVFPSTMGTPMDGCNLTHRFHQITAAVGLPKIRFHDLRHTAATLLLAQGVHPRLVMEILGHASISLTMNTYSHVLASMQDQIADSMDAILEQPEKANSDLVATSVATLASGSILQ